MLSDQHVQPQPPASLARRRGWLAARPLLSWLALGTGVGAVHGGAVMACLGFISPDAFSLAMGVPAGESVIPGTMTSGLAPGALIGGTFALVLYRRAARRDLLRALLAFTLFAFVLGTVSTGVWLWLLTSSDRAAHRESGYFYARITLMQNIGRVWLFGFLPFAGLWRFGRTRGGPQTPSRSRPDGATDA